jgi:hypothetical protein
LKKIKYEKISCQIRDIGNRRKFEFPF